MFEFHKYLQDNFSFILLPLQIIRSSSRAAAAAAAAVYSSPPSKMKPWEIGFEADHLEEAVYGFPSGRYFKKVDQCLLALFFFQMWQESQAKIYNKLGLAENGGMKKLIWMASITRR